MTGVQTCALPICDTPGKATFIEALKDKYPQLEEEDLEELTVDEIVSHLTQEGLDYSEYQDDDQEPDTDEHDTDGDDDTDEEGDDPDD